MRPVESDETIEERSERRIELIAAAVMAVATILTAWSAYQSAKFGERANAHQLKVLGAIVNQSKFASLAEQRRSLDVNIFGQWMIAANGNNTKLASFIFDRFPAHLEKAVSAWQATDPLNDHNAPSSPFSMPEYVVKESLEENIWLETAQAESATSEQASAVSDRYLLFTVIFATTLFFAGISGKFGEYWINVGVLVFGGLTLVISAVFLLTLPVA